MERVRNQPKAIRVDSIAHLNEHESEVERQEDEHFTGTRLLPARLDEVADHGAEAKHNRDVLAELEATAFCVSRLRLLVRARRGDNARYLKQISPGQVQAALSVEE